MENMYACIYGYTKNNAIICFQVAAEIQAQIDRFEHLTGSKPVNVDGHQHIHCFPGI